MDTQNNILTNTFRQFIAKELKEYFDEEDTKKTFETSREGLSNFMQTMFEDLGERNLPYLEVEELRTSEDGSIFFTYYSNKIGKGILLDYKGLCHDTKYTIEELTELIYKNIENMVNLENKLPNLK